jgi:hypothetical protein
MVARTARYETPPDAVDQLLDEIVALARARRRRPVQQTSRRAELFFVETSLGAGLSLVVGDDRSVTPVIELERPSSEDPEEWDVHLLQVGGPRRSGVVNALFGRVVRCEPGTVGDLSFDGDAVPASPAVWARGLLVQPGGQALAFAVATDRAALEHSLEKFSSRCTRVDDYDEVAYHFLGAR